MAYCTYEEVGSLLSLTFNSSSNPTSDRVTEIIDWIASEIDFALASIGVSDVPASSALYKILSMRNAQGAASIVGFVLYGNRDNIESGQAAKYEKQYKDFLEDINRRSSFFRSQVSSGISLSNQFTNGDMTPAELDSIMLPDKFEA